MLLSYLGLNPCWLSSKTSFQGEHASTLYSAYFNIRGHVLSIALCVVQVMTLLFVWCSYRIRLPTEKEQEMKVSKEVKKMRFYESTLLSAYKVRYINL